MVELPHNPGMEQLVAVQKLMLMALGHLVPIAKEMAGKVTLEVCLYHQFAISGTSC
jgi:hypothetical protein